MERRLRILILEDVPADAELIEDVLAGAGLKYDARVVSTRGTFLKALEEAVPDAILADYSLPGFGGLEALEIAGERYPAVPFIFVSGALGEELAVELLKKGATDYVLKDRLFRLAPALTRALQEAGERAERKRIEEALKGSEIRYRTIFENTGTATIIVDKDGLIALANGQFGRLTGYSRQAMEGRRKWMEFVLEADLPAPGEMGGHGGRGAGKKSQECEFRITGRLGEVRHVVATIAWIASTDHAVVSFLDITRRKAAEEALKKREQELEVKSEGLEDANRALKVLLKRREEDKAELEEQVLVNVRRLVFPYLTELKHMKLNDLQTARVETIEKHLQDIVSPFLRTLSSAYQDLTPREIQIASLVRDGKTTKEITDLLNISTTAVDFHRKNLRSKFGIKNKKTNLRSYLASLSS